MLYRPQQYYVGTDATFSLTTYSSETFEVTLSLVYQQCTCDERDGLVHMQTHTHTHTHTVWSFSHIV